MGKFVAGDVISLRFPFSDYSTEKVRPALVLAQAEFENLIVCQITSKSYTSRRAILITPNDFVRGGLPILSYTRIDKIFTIDPKLVGKLSGRLKPTKTTTILKQVRKLFA